MNNKYDWRYENSISYTKTYSDPSGIVEHKYVPWRTNRYFSNFIDTVLYVNEINMHSHLDNKLQYDYLFHSIRKNRRFFKNQKSDKSENLALVQNYYKYNVQRAKEVLRILTPEQLEYIRNFYSKGGTWFQ